MWADAASGGLDSGLHHNPLLTTADRIVHESDRHPSAQREHDTSTFDARMKAAGLDTLDPDALDIDTFRLTVARTIAMYTNEWHGCPDLICQRNRSCMAPDIRCSNVPRLPPEEEEKEWWKVRDEIALALHKGIAERLAREGVSEADL